MSVPILLTKLFVPPARPELVTRSRLIEQLNHSLHRKLTLISAPAGFGKTTLVIDWLQTQGDDASSPFLLGWLSLDEGDNDPTRFLTYLITALNRIEGLESEIGVGALQLVQSSQPPQPKTVLISVINEIAMVTDKIVLILDDFHLIDSRQVHDSLNFLIENLPPQLHLVLTTREDPPIPMSRLRASGQLNEIRAMDLRFTVEETAVFLQTMGLNLSSPDITALETRTEGWISGIQLAAISMQGIDDTAGFIQSFTGSNRFVLDYLIEEVLNQQSNEIQDFLFQTAILDRLTGGLCDAVTGQNHSQIILESLVQNNLFIIPLDEERRWYRYHHLFADLLRQRQNQTQAENIPALHIRASKWFSKEGANQEAIKHSLAAKDFERGIELIEAIGVDILQQGNLASVSGWINIIPEETIIKHPYLCVLHAWILQVTGEVETAEARLTLVEQILDHTFEQKDHDFDKTVGLLNYRKAYSCFLSGEHEKTISYAKNALNHLLETAVLIRVHTVLFLGLAYRNLGQFQEALDTYNSILHLTENLGGTSVAVFHYIHLSDLYWEMAQMQHAKELCEKALSLTEQKTGRPDMPYCGFVYTRIGRILRHRNQLEDALAFTMKGHTLCLNWNVVELLALSYIEVAYINLALGNNEQALTSVNEAIRINDKFSSLGKKFAEAHKALIGLSQDDRAYAETIMQADNSLLDEKYQIQREIEYITHAQLLIAQKKFDEAKVLINQIYKHAQEIGKKLTELRCLILFSKLFYQEDDVDQALENLSKAFAIAEPEGFIRIFVDEGPLMAKLLHETLSRAIAQEYVQTLLAAFPVNEPEQMHQTQPQSHEFEWIDPLSEREIEVLQHIAEGLSRQEIAVKLVLSKNTVKTHARNIYSKLGVNSQMQAVAKARALGLLENE